MTGQDGVTNRLAAMVVKLAESVAQEWLAAAAELTEEQLAAGRGNLPLRYLSQECNVYQW